jgi:phosphoribosylformylglycinamidine (FGAM) synthase PurS component
MKTYTINSQKAISETLEGETIIINLENGSYYSVNNAGTAIWNAIKQNSSINTEGKDVSDFLDFLQKEGLTQLSTGEAMALAIDQKDFKDPKIEKYVDMQEMLLADPVHDVSEAGWPKLKAE